MLRCEGSWPLGILCRPRSGCHGAPASLALEVASVCLARAEGQVACAVQAPQRWACDAASLCSSLRASDLLPSLAQHLLQALPGCSRIQARFSHPHLSTSQGMWAMPSQVAPMVLQATPAAEPAHLSIIRTPSFPVDPLPL